MLRQVSHHVKEKVTAFRWRDVDTVVNIKKLQEWRASFPYSDTLNISKTKAMNNKLANDAWKTKSLFRGMENITYLNIAGTKFRTSTFSNFPNLELLVCGKNSFLTSFTGLSKVRYLSIRDESVKFPLCTEDLPSLETLSIEAENFVVSFPDFICPTSWIGKLKRLCFYGDCSMKFINFPPGSPKDNATVPHLPGIFLKKFHSLEILRINGINPDTFHFAGLDDGFFDISIQASHILDMKNLIGVELRNINVDMFSKDFMETLRARKCLLDVKNCHPVTHALYEMVNGVD